MVFKGKVLEIGDEAVLISEAKYTLFGHSNRIIGLQWSPHDDNRLVSVSFDGTARVSLKCLGVFMAKIMNIPFIESF